MAELLNYADPGDPPAKRLRLSLFWQKIRYDPDPGEPIADLQIGIFLGDEPLFADTLYDRANPYRLKWLKPGYFHIDDDGCQLLDGLWGLLTTGKAVDFENFDPWVRIIVARDINWMDDADPAEIAYVDVLTIIQHGGPWHGGGMGSAGPAAVIGVDRAALEAFFYDLLDEAIASDVIDAESRAYLTEHFAEALARRQASK